MEKRILVAENPSKLYLPMEQGSSNRFNVFGYVRTVCAGISGNFRCSLFGLFKLFTLFECSDGSASGLFLLL